jgi:hypothetical protein
MAASGLLSGRKVDLMWQIDVLESLVNFLHISHVNYQMEQFYTELKMMRQDVASCGELPGKPGRGARQHLVIRQM